MVMGTEVNVDRVACVATITINRPHVRNSLALTTVTELADAFDAASADEELRCVVLRGQGDHFCAGADLRSAFQRDPDLLDHLDAYMDAFHRVVRSVVRCRKPTIASIDGAAVGFGADLALACDLRIASTSAYIQEKFVSIGLMPDGGGTFWLPRHLGLARAMKAMLLADKLDGAVLQELGLLVDLVVPEMLQVATRELAERLAQSAPLALAAIKQTVHENMGPIEDALAREREGQLRLLRSKDVREGVSAWVEKRTPVFRGL